MAIQTKDIVELIVRPVLLGMNMNSLAAEQLIIGTIAQESQMGTYLKQMQGPARGICQMEPATHDDIYKNFLQYNEDLRRRLYIVSNLSLPAKYTVPPSDLLVFNLRYATAMCRLQYFRQKEALPGIGDIQGMAAYWKKYYNSKSGKGDEAAFMLNYNRFAKPYYSL